MSSKLQINSLVLYKIRPARVIGIDDKIEIELEGGKTKRVRDKDVHLLHPGPLASLKALRDDLAEATEAWELLDGEATTFSGLMELVFERPSPVDAWSLWLRVADGVYFEGEPDAIKPRSAEAVEQELNVRAEKANAEREWAGFLDRMKARQIDEGDRKRLSEVERLAYGAVEQSRILQELEISASPENAYRMLVDVGYWAEDHNPHPGRQGPPTESPDYPVGELPEEERHDFTALAAYAIDDEDSNDPDDAISLDGDRIWVHVADVAALVIPDSEIDREARARGANLYLPEVVSNMLPPALTDRLGLGLQAESPALSIGFRLDDVAELTDIDIRISRIRATRISYAEANNCMAEEPFAGLKAITDRYRQRRKASGSAGLDLPEVSVKLKEGRPVIKTLAPLDSREMVTDAMLMAGEAVASYCQTNGIPIPYAVQAPPDEARSPQTLSEMYAYRRFFKPTQSAASPGLHAGLGLHRYARSTSPLRRYQDLLVHQQLRAHLRGEPCLPESEVSIRASQADEGSALRRRTERFSNQHWKLVWLKQRPGWKGRAVVVDKDERKVTLLIPELALETKIRVRDGLTLDEEVTVQIREVDLAEQTGYFRVL